MTGQWQELKETIIEMRNNDGIGTQQEVCKFLANLMDVLEKQMQEPRTGYWKLVYRECDTVFYLCSRCNEGRAVIDGDNYKSLDEFKICPHCGARMFEQEESEVKEV